MPELPEVETIRADLDQAIRGLAITDIDVRDARILKGLPEEQFKTALAGRRIGAVLRRGKALIFDLKSGFLVVQPMMTGQVIAVPPREELPVVKETRIVFRLSKGWALLYNDQRLFGRLLFVDAVHEHDYLKKLGVEPLSAEFTAAYLADKLKGRRTPIKQFLLDHRVIAGIGNIYASEILFEAGIRPEKKADELTKKEVERLHQSTGSVLREAVRLRGTSMRNYRDGAGQEGKYRSVIRVYARQGEPCPVCKAPVVRIVQAQRSTFYCGRCQK